VLLRQRFDGVAAARDGMISLAISEGRLLYVSSSLTGDPAVTNRTRLSPTDAYVAAARKVGRRITPRRIDKTGEQGGWRTMEVQGFSVPQRTRLRALPTPRNGVRLVYETLVVDTRPEAVAYSSFVDAATGEILLQESQIDYEADSPEWKVFPNAPPLDYSSADTRETWCWSQVGGCDRVLDPSAPQLEWDVNPRTGTSTHTTFGNNARTVDNWFNIDPFSVGVVPAKPSPTREYVYPWTNQWFEERCNPRTTFLSPRRNDRNASIANLFAMHNRMHDWAFHLGFTERNFNMQEVNFSGRGRPNDPEQGNAQAGAVTGGPPLFFARDNANQITFNDGIAPITNMYLWQPIAGAFYAPCVDGDYDMSVIGHEYTHAISNRMVAGPDAGLVGPQAGAMGESWSDLTAVEYLYEFGFSPVDDENPFAVGPYVTGDKRAGIRNYGMNRSPLNYSNIGYDTTGPQVHADGEIWSATNFDIRRAFVRRYGKLGQLGCANGETPASQCSGNRRWMQLVFDAYLLPATGKVSFVDMRDAYLIADRMRFGGANQDLLWNAFARRGLGRGAFSNSVADANPIPSFRSPFAGEASVAFRPTDSTGEPIKAELFVGRHEARSMPVADSRPNTLLGSRVELVPGSYQFLVRGDGFGSKRLRMTLSAGEAAAVAPAMPLNLASRFNGATATGDGIDTDDLVDDTEETNWQSLGAPVRGRSVTVRLGAGRRPRTIGRVQVSAMIRPSASTEAPQSRFSALRQFEIWTCAVGSGVDCSADGDYARIFRSPADAFPAVAPRPRSPQLILRSFSVPRTRASFVRLVVVANQCTGTPAYRGDQDDDETNVTDCPAGSGEDRNVRAAELQVFRR
jgi:extracellular elastinolytic metalloproteinase